MIPLYNSTAKKSIRFGIKILIICAVSAKINPSTTGYGRRRRRNGAVCRDPILAESLFRNSGRSEWAVDNSPAAFPSISYNGTAAGNAFRKTAASARLRRSARLVFHIPDIR